MPASVILILVLVIVGVIALAWWAHELEQKRIAAVGRWSAARGWAFDPTERDDPGRNSGIPHLERGQRRYGQCWISGTWKDRAFRMCEYHYQITTSNGKSSSTRHYWSTVLWMDSPRVLKALAIRPERWSDKVAGFLGFHDIEFESTAFNRAFHVTAADRRWASLALPPASLELLLEHPTLEVHTQPRSVVVIASERLDPHLLNQPLRLADGLLNHIPDFA